MIVPNKTIWTYGPHKVGKSTLVHLIGETAEMKPIHSSFPRTKRFGSKRLVLFEDIDSQEQWYKRIQSLVKYLSMDMLDQNVLVWCTSLNHPEKVLGKTKWKVFKPWIHVINLEETSFGKWMAGKNLDKGMILQKIKQKSLILKSDPNLWKNMSPLLDAILSFPLQENETN